jgi:acyl-CoA reductase-like NAD-dependent aldehyde dehydrogenase
MRDALCCPIDRVRTPWKRPAEDGSRPGAKRLLVVSPASSEVSETVVNDFPLNGHGTHPQEIDGARARGSNGGAPLEPDRTILPIAPHGTRAGELPKLSEETRVRAAVARARAAQYEWHLRPVGERAAALTRAAQTMLRRRAEVIALAREEMGKGDVEGLFNETLGPLDSVKGWTRIVERALGPHRVRLNPLSFPRKSAQIDLVPRGVVGVIAPWNYPVAGLYRSTFPALLCGNGLVVKPSEYTPKTSGRLVERLAAEVPEGLVHVVQGDGRVGAALIDAGIDACVFTGSPQTGRAVRVHCAERGIPSSIEMGGKDPAIVLADCDLPRTVAGVTHWALSNAGQACGAIEIAYVDERIADAFVDAMRRAWTRLRVGPGHLSDVGPLANRRQLELVTSHVEDARAHGAVVVCGGTPVEGSLLFPPTILDRCDERMSVVRDETFGPVLAVVRVAGAAEAVRRTNELRYGLGASIWTRDIARAKRLAGRLDVGVVTINNHAFSGAVPALPWGGTRDTGFGVANSQYSLATFVRPRSTIVDRASAPELFWMPYDETLWKLGNLLADLQTGRFDLALRLPIAIHKRMSTLRDFFRL